MQQCMRVTEMNTQHTYSSASSERARAQPTLGITHRGKEGYAWTTNAIHEWLIKCFGPIQEKWAWQQISQLPEEIRAQMMSQDPSRLPDPAEVQQMMAAFSAGGLNTMGDMQRTVEEGPINVKLAKSIALQQANASGSQQRVRSGR